MTRPRTTEGYRGWIEGQEFHGLDPSLDPRKARPMGLDEKLMVGLRTREGVDLDFLAKCWGWDEEHCTEYLSSLELRWKDAIEAGWLKQIGRRWQLSDPLGMEISNQVIIQMLIWWDCLPCDAVSLPNL